MRQNPPRSNNTNVLCATELIVLLRELKAAREVVRCARFFGENCAGSWALHQSDQLEAALAAYDAAVEDGKLQL